MRKLAWLLLALVLLACTPQPPLPPQGFRQSVSLSPPGARRARVSLTTRDGRSVPLTNVWIEATLEGPLVSTSMWLLFPDTSPSEGHLTVALPAGASVTSLTAAMGARQLMIGVAPKIFEPPAENLVVTRVPAGTSAVRVTYLETLPTAFTPYRILLAGLPRLTLLNVRLLIPELRHEYFFVRENEAPTQDFVVFPPRMLPSAVRSERFAVVRVETSPPGTAETLGDVAVLVDSSASHAPTYAANLARAERLLGRLRSTHVRIAAFDQEVVPLTFAGAAARRALGATDLGAALAWAKGADRTVLVTDGALELPAAVTASRIDVITSGSAAEAQPLALAGLRSGAIVGPTDDDESAIRALASPGGAIRRASFAGAVGVWPTSLATKGAASSSALAFVELSRNVPRLAYAEPTGLEPLRVTTTWLKLEQLVLEAQLRELEQQRLAAGTWSPDQTALTQKIVAVAERLRAVLRTDSASIEAIPPDADGDGVPDLLDSCPLQRADPPNDPLGCARGPVVVDENHDFWLQPIRFGPNSAVVPPQYLEQVDFVAKNLERHREYELAAVFGHADKNERDVLTLSQARAEAIRALLLERGIAKERLLAKGVGTRWPEREGNDDFARTMNRRGTIGFLIAYGRSTGVEYVKEFPEIFPHNGKLWPTQRPYRGELQSVIGLLEQRKTSEAITRAEAWARRTPNDMLAWVALGRAIDASGDAHEAARAYGSILELRKSGERAAERASRRRAVATLLEPLATRHPPALTLAIEQYRRAHVDYPHEVASPHGEAWALAQQGDTKRALEVLAEAKASFPDDAKILDRDAELIGGRGTPAALATWESVDGHHADIDLVGFDAKNRPIYAPEDVTWGHGPELLPLSPPPARLEVHLMASDPDEYVIGKVMIVKPGSAVESRPFVMMTQGSVLVP